MLPRQIAQAGCTAGESNLGRFGRLLPLITAAPIHPAMRAPRKWERADDVGPLARLSGSVGHFALDLILLQAPEIGDLLGIGTQQAPILTLRHYALVGAQLGLRQVRLDQS